MGFEEISNNWQESAKKYGAYILDHAQDSNDGQRILDVIINNDKEKISSILKGSDLAMVDAVINLHRMVNESATILHGQCDPLEILSFSKPLSDAVKLVVQTIIIDRILAEEEALQVKPGALKESSQTSKPSSSPIHGAVDKNLQTTFREGNGRDI